MARPGKLGDDDIRARLADLPGWEFRGGKLRRELEFDDFVGAFAFVSGLAVAAEGMNHHPEWSNVYNRVVVELSTHDAGGVTELDFRLASRANRLLP